MKHTKAGERQYSVGDRVTVLYVIEEELAQPRECLFKHGVVTVATDIQGWTRVGFPKWDNTGWFFKPNQLCYTDDGVVFAAFHQVQLDYQKGIELEVALAQNGFKLITL